MWKMLFLQLQDFEKFFNSLNNTSFINFVAENFQKQPRSTDKVDKLAILGTVIGKKDRFTKFHVQVLNHRPSMQERTRVSLSKEKFQLKPPRLIILTKMNRLTPIILSLSAPIRFDCRKVFVLVIPPVGLLKPMCNLDGFSRNVF